jgi:hypothetical protein
VSSPEQATPGKYYKSGSIIHLTADDGGDPGEKGHIYQLRIYRIIAIRHFIPLFLLSVILLLPSKINKFLTSSNKPFCILIFYRETLKLILKGHSNFTSYKTIFFTIIFLILLFAKISFTDGPWIIKIPNPNVGQFSLFCDYYLDLGFLARDNRYLGGGILSPPLAMLLNTKLVGDKAIEKHQATNLNPGSSGKYMSAQTFQIDAFSYGKAIFVTFFILFCLLLMFNVNLKEENVVIKSLLILVMFSTPSFQDMMLSGNKLGLCALLSAFFIFNYKHQEKLIRESALIALALAAGLKIYPAFLGLLVLYEKDCRAVLRLVLYGVLAFIIPLLILNRDLWIENMVTYINTLLNESQYNANPLFDWRVLTYRGEGLNLKIDKFLKFANYALAALALLTNHCQNINWKRVLQICMTFMLIVPRVYPRAAIFVIIPMILYFNENEEETDRYDLVYLSLFIAILSPLYYTRLHYVFRGIASQILIFILLYESACSFIHRYVKKSKPTDQLSSRRLNETFEDS